ncbi:Tripartite tricarboxylate transporter family receptor [Pigmentiphaga humi]|uniref:Tripartite tricarboxylate transporter family receptor n=1 Tax=Pigmentiphaga humi TaxID=2478468 RepID=A0A3P4B470_9BURK|nr:tripartite tricarboxylate transporter substrate binding protein [Pigmentiphaga humi]VCU71083.1 Tripartite tricarboxylate transporter family receptor [Pigmentiphaga humi]
MMNVKTFSKAAFTTMALVLGVCAHAEWPERPITLVVPWPPGGGVDAAARLAAPLMSKALGQQVVVTNKAGATGNIGAESVATSAPDGYTLLWSSLSSHAINASLYQNIPFDLEKSFAPISVFGRIPFAIMVNPSVPANSVQELIALAKAKPGSLSFGSSGNGSTSHLFGEMFQRATGVSLLHVPYKGIAPEIVDLVGGQINMSIESVSATLPHFRSQKLRPLAVATPERISLLPDVPTTDEAGLKGYRASATLVAAAPAGTPAPIVEKLNGVINRALADKSIQEQLLGLSIITINPSPAESAKMIHDEISTFRTVIREANIQP